ncbi:MAG: hypothetical protein KDD66_04710 [Bdellovibrionales bacterium]|nr:hypothetical protein [Bdellovibrionales bacterium]
MPGTHKSLTIFFTAIMLFSIGCSSNELPEPREYVEAPPAKVSVGSKPAEVPPGVVRYCWEEPIVAFEQNGPGVDQEGNWYHPSYIAVRQVRSGKWRPCEAEIEREVR